jgi:NADPH-dependent 2,4-dienoyl-CoA reductase/sulfur reductase-like enzyme/rhodanese-related sulfurtransferase
MKIIIVGGVAAGATAASRARRLDERAEITLLERGPYVSYANCGLPYFLSGAIQDRNALLLQTPAGFRERYAVEVRVGTEAVEIDRPARRVLARGPAGDEWLPYDKLILAQGGLPVMPPVPGIDSPHVFRLWTVPDMDRLQDHLERVRPRTAVVVGGGFIGLEMAEAFRARGLETTVVELVPTVMAVMDPEFGGLVARELEANGVRVLTGVGVLGVDTEAKTVSLSDGRHLSADVVLFSVGVRPELSLARQAGLEVGPSGGLQVNENLQTSDPDIYAAGDMIEVTHKVSGRRVRIPLAGPANRQGRIAASNALGVPMAYAGAVGTSVVKIFDATAGMTGLSEKAARDAGFAVGVAMLHKNHHAGYYPGAQELSLKIVYDRETSRLLGAQAFGHAGVDKRIDVLATALQGRFTLADLAELDLAYAPPYSSANDPINIAAFIGLNDISGFDRLATANELAAEIALATPPLVLDVRRPDEFEESHMGGAMHIPLDMLRERCEELPAGRSIVVHCRTGFRSHIAVRMLKQRGFEDVRNLTGGYLSMLRQAGLPLGSILGPL